MDELPIGRRVAYWRGRRKMSQQVFADRLGKSKSWVDKVERGVRRLDKFSVVYEIADVLQVDVQLLLGKDPERRPETRQLHRPGRGRGDPRRAGALRPDQRVLRRAAAPAAADRDAQGGQPRLADLPAREVRRAGPDAAQAAARRPGRRHARTPAATSARDAAHLLGQVYQIASSALRKLGEHELAWLAADRSIAVSQRAGDPLLAGIATYRVGSALLALGRARPALEVNVNIANRLAPGDGNDGHPGTALGLRHAAAPGRHGRGPDRRQRDRARPARRRRARRPPRWAATTTTTGPASARPTCSCTGPPRRWSWATGGTAVETHERIDPEGFDGAAAGAAGAPLPRHRPRVRPDRRRREGQRDAAGGRPARPVGDPLPAARPRGPLRRAAPHPGHAAGAGRRAGRAHGSRRMSVGSGT